MTDDPEGITKELETQTKLAEERLIHAEIPPGGF